MGCLPYYEFSTRNTVRRKEAAQIAIVPDTQFDNQAVTAAAEPGGRSSHRANDGPHETATSSRGSVQAACWLENVGHAIGP